MAKFSIIIPAYDAQAYLGACLASLLAQPFGDWEAIGVDDGAHDESGALLDDCVRREARLKVVHQAHTGASGARNRGLTRAAGEWVWFVDADDTLAPEALATLAQQMPPADVTYFGMTFCCHDGFWAMKVPPMAWAETPAERDRLLLRLATGEIGTLFGWACNKVIRRALIERHRLRFDATLSIHEDEVFALCFMNHAQTIATLPQALYNYRLVETGLTAKGIPDPYALVRAYLRVCSKAASTGVCTLANLRITELLRPLIADGRSLRAAKRLIEAKKRLRGRFPVKGPYERLLARLCRWPTCLAAPILFLIHWIKR